jgi:Zn-finger nucleic acid-binding protein
MNDMNRDTQVLCFDQDGQLSNTPSGVHCPKCQNIAREIELLIGVIKGCQFAGCKHCGGMLFQQETFAMLMGHLRASSPPPLKMPEPMDASQLNVRRRCPTCDAMFETHPYAGPGNSVIDTCITCHVVWFDHGELNKLVTAPGRR